MTPDQYKALAFIADGIARNGWSPTLQEITDHIGCDSRSGGPRMVTGLLAGGLIRRLPHQEHRNLDLTDAGYAALARKVAA